jgi:hypothetical protein
VKARKRLPRRKKRVITPLGEGIVVDIYPLKESVQVELESGGQHEFPHDDIQPYEELEALRNKAQAPCDKHEGGNCDCGKTQTRTSKRKKKKKRRR